MKFSGKIEDGTSNEPLNFGSKMLPCRRFALSECTLRVKICALRVLLVIISNPRRGCYMGLFVFIFSFFFFFFFFFPATILSGPYLWNRYSQRLQIECAAWSCGLIVHCCLPSNSLRYFFFYFFLFFYVKILSGPYLWNHYSQRLQIECAA